MSRTCAILAGTFMFALASGLTACGKVGELERPGPMFGGTAAPQAPGPDPSPTVSIVDPRDRSTAVTLKGTAPDETSTPDSSSAPR